MPGAEFIHDDGGLECKHAAVPEKIPGVDVLLGGLSIRLFDKPLDAQRTFGNYGIPFNIAVAGFGIMGRDAEGNNMALIREPNGRFEPFEKNIDLTNDMVGWTYT